MPPLRFPVLAIALVVGCAPSEGEVTIAVSAPIQGGYEDTVDKAVVGILHAPTGSACTGTLIAPNVVLTARHCVSPTVDGDSGVVCGETSFADTQPGGGFLVTTADELTLGSAGEHFGAVVVGLAGIPGIPAHVEDDTPFCGHDVAIIILDDNVPADKATPYLPRLSDDLAPGELYSAVGFGGEDDMGTGFGIRRRRDDLAVTCLGAACTEEQVVAAGQITPAEWVGNGGVCQGDSGGPALDAEDRVMGVTSRGTAGCDLSLYGYVAPLSQWLKNTVVYASGMGLYEAPSWTEGATVDPEHSMPVGDLCSAPDECPSGKCTKEGYCTRACDEDAPCPQGWSCQVREGGPVCAEPPLAPVGHVIPKKDDGCGVSGRSDGSWLALLAGGLFMMTRRRKM